MIAISRTAKQLGHPSREEEVLGVQFTGTPQAAPYARPVGLSGTTGEGARVPPRSSIQFNGWVPTPAMTQQGT